MGRYGREDAGRAIEILKRPCSCHSRSRTDLAESYRWRPMPTIAGHDVPPNASADRRDRSVFHRSAPLAAEGRRRLVERCQTRRIAHVAAGIDISHACASKWVTRFRHRHLPADRLSDTSTNLPMWISRRLGRIPDNDGDLSEACGPEPANSQRVTSPRLGVDGQ